MKRPASVIAGLQAPISARIAVRRSTAVIAVLFLGLGALWLQVKTTPSTAATNTDKALGQALDGLKPNESFIISRAPTSTSRATPTTVTTRPASSTTVGSSSTTGPTSPTTATTRATTTTSPDGRSTTTSPPTATTSVGSVGGGPPTTPGSGG